jgi:hypothetical protein
MDLQDKELLDKQLRHVAVPPRGDGIVIVAMVALFLGGLIIGGLLTEPRAQAPSATNDHIALATPGDNIRR